MQTEHNPSEEKVITERLNPDEVQRAVTEHLIFPLIKRRLGFDEGTNEVRIDRLSDQPARQVLSTPAEFS